MIGKRNGNTDKEKGKEGKSRQREAVQRILHTLRAGGQKTVEHGSGASHRGIIKGRVSPVG